MGDKIDNINKKPITKFTSIFVSNPKVVNPAEYGNYDNLHLVPLDDLLNDNDENKHKK